MKRGTITLAAFGALVLGLIGAYLATTFTIERHQGFFAPVWDPQGRYVYFIERQTFGLTWGLGREHFTPPAHAYAITDTISLKRLAYAGRRIETLQTWSTTPVKGRVIEEYRGRIFNTAWAYIDTGDDNIEYQVGMDLPRIPTSDHYHLKGRWPHEAGPPPRWQNKWTNRSGIADNVLVNGREVLSVRGREFFPAAILVIDQTGASEVLVKNDAFAALYPNGVPAKMLQERSHRATIERGRERRRVRGELVTGYRAQGMRDGDAQIKAIGRMRELGYYPKGPRLVAAPIDQPAPTTTIFEISAAEFRFGMLQDIEKALREPGAEIEKSMGQYVRHRDFTTSGRLNDWLRQGNTTFVVLHLGRYYEITLLR